MSLEKAVEDNTVAIRELIVALEAQLKKHHITHMPTLTSAQVNEPADTKNSVPNVEVVTLSSGVTYEATRSLILRLSKDYREEIKTILADNGLKKLSDTLNDPSSPEEGVKNVDILQAVFEAISALES